MSRIDSRPVTQKEVAERAGVSSAVVSYVINNGPRHVSEETRQRVLEAIAALGYRPNKFAQALGKSESAIADNQIGIIIGGSSRVLQHPFYASVLSGIFDEVHNVGYRIRFMHFWDDLKDPVLFNEHIHPEEASSLIVLAADLMRIDPDFMTTIERIEARIPHLVCLDTQINNFTTITFDRFAAARMVVEHFIALGHTRIAFVGNSGRRVNSFRQVMMMHGIPIAADYIQHPGMYNSPDEGYEGAARLLALPTPPTAIFAASDDVAIGVFSAIRAAGLSIPEDVSVAGIDDNPYSRYLFPALTTVRVPTAEMGAHAVHVIRTHDTAPTSGTTLIIDSTLIVRESSRRHAALPD